MSSCCRWEGDRLHIAVRVQPRSGSDQVAGVTGDEVKIRLMAPPVDGEANRALIRFLARQFRVPQSRVDIRSGVKGRSKHLIVSNPVTLPDWLPAPVRAAAAEKATRSGEDR